MTLIIHGTKSAKDCILSYRSIAPPDISPPKHRKIYRTPVWKSAWNTVVTASKCKRYAYKNRPPVRTTRDVTYRPPIRTLGLIVSPLLRSRLREPQRFTSCSHLNMIPRLTLPRTTKPQKGGTVPLRSVTKDSAYFYETRSGVSSDSSQLGLQSRILQRISARGFAHMYTRTAATRTEGLSERLYNIYATRTMSADTSKQLGLQSRIIELSSGCKVAQFYASRPTGLYMPQRLHRTIVPLGIQRTKDLDVRVPNAISSRQYSKWSRPFLPNLTTNLLSSSQSHVRKSRLLATSAQLPKSSRTALRIRDSELVSTYNPKRITLESSPVTSRIHTPAVVLGTGKMPISSDVGSRFHSDSSRVTSRIHKPAVSLDTGKMPISSDVGLRLRLNLRLSSLALSHLYPASAISTPVSETSSRRTYKIQSNYENNSTLSEKIRLRLSRPQVSNLTVATRYGSLPVQCQKYTSELDLKTKPRYSKTSNFSQHYPTELPKQTKPTKFSLRPLPSNALMPKKFKRLDQILSEIEDDCSDISLPVVSSVSTVPNFVRGRPLSSSASNYVHLYEAHPETLASSQLGDRLKLSLRSSTSKVAFLYASHPVDPQAPERRRHPKPKPTWRIPDKYSADKYVPRPGILSTIKLVRE